MRLTRSLWNLNENMNTYQQGILNPLPENAIFLEFDLAVNGNAEEALVSVGALPVDDDLVVGLGQSLISANNKSLAELRAFPALSGPAGCEVPSTQAGLWCWLSGNDRGELFHKARALAGDLAPDLRLVRMTDSFKHDTGRDLSGYEDGTENPLDGAAVEAAIVPSSGGALAGSSFVAVQNWLHDFDVLDEISQNAKDDLIGRHQSDNEEFDEAPESAHVKRTAQESFTPEAFVVRRSMPWNDGLDGGLMFVAFGHTLDAFEAQLRRMVGLDDGIVDGLFSFTTPVSGSYFWCPPVGKNGLLDLSAIA